MFLNFLWRALVAFFTGASMSFFSNLGTWFIQSGLADKTKQAAVEALTKSANDFVAQINQHSPDLKTHLETQVATVLAQSVAGALTRSK